MSNHPSRNWRGRMHKTADEWLDTPGARVLIGSPADPSQEQGSLRNRIRAAYLAGYQDGRDEATRRSDATPALLQRHDEAHTTAAAPPAEVTKTIQIGRAASEVGDVRVGEYVALIKGKDQQLRIAATARSYKSIPECLQASVMVIGERLGDETFSYEQALALYQTGGLLAIALVVPDQ